MWKGLCLHTSNGERASSCCNDIQQPKPSPFLAPDFLWWSGKGTLVDGNPSLSWLCHKLAVWPWGIQFLFLGLGFFKRKLALLCTDSIHTPADSLCLGFSIGQRMPPIQMISGSNDRFRIK